MSYNLCNYLERVMQVWLMVKLSGAENFTVNKKIWDLKGRSVVGVIYFH